MLNSSSSASSSRLALLAVGLDHFEHGADVLLDREAAEDRGFLRQIADAEARALIHRQLGDVVAVELDGAAIGLDQAGDHVEHRGLAGAVRAEQADRLAAAHIDADAAHDLAGAETLFHAMHGQDSPAAAVSFAVPAAPLSGACGGALVADGGRRRRLRCARRSARPAEPGAISAARPVRARSAAHPGIGFATMSPKLSPSAVISPASAQILTNRVWRGADGTCRGNQPSALRLASNVIRASSRHVRSLGTAWRTRCPLPSRTPSASMSIKTTRDSRLRRASFNLDRAPLSIGKLLQYLLVFRARAQV